jgi:CCR4-NOT transcriptional regulation complex NOT5 subunit
MSKFEFNQLYLQLERDIKHLAFTTEIEYRNSTLEDVQEVISEMKNDIENWVSQLNERSIACYELELILESKRPEIVLKRLQNKGISEEKIETIKGDILRFIAKAILNIYLDSLFRNQNRKLNQNDFFIEN